MSENFSASLRYLLILAALTLGLAPAASATVYYASPTGTGNGSSWAASGSLQPIITAARSGDQVWVKEGTYTGNFTATDGVAVYGGFAGTETIISHRNVVSNPTVLDANYVGTAYTIPSTATGTNTVDGLTIQNGVGTGGISAAIAGGLYDSSASDVLNVANCTFINNGATNDSGGGISAFSRTLTVSNCTFTNNNAFVNGGGIYADGMTATISDCAFANNIGDGGGIYTLSKASISDCTFTGNSAYYGSGGGIYVISNANIRGCTFSGNVASSGGGISAGGTASAPTTIANCTFTSNITPFLGNGGGISAGGVVTVADCIFGGVGPNDVNGPDAICLADTGDPSTTPVTPTIIKDCLIIGSGATSNDPDGISLDEEFQEGPSYATFANNTITNVYRGILIESDSGATGIANNIFDGSYLSLYAPFSTGPTFTLSHNDFHANTYNSQGVSLSVTDLFNDPGFLNASIGNNRLAVGSLLLNAGDATDVAAGDTDLDGNPRLVNGKVDIGAYEGAHSPTWTAAAVSAGPNGTSRILWNRSDGASGLWVLGADNAYTAVGPTYGPYSGWIAKAVVTTPDGASRVLWTNVNGAAELWTFDAKGNETLEGTVYGPYAGYPPQGLYYSWTAQAVGVAGDGTSRVLWTNINGQAGLWSFDTKDNETIIGSAYGPYSGWTAKSLATASDGTSRVLWDNANGQAGVWSFGTNDAMSVIGMTYGPFTGWTAKAIGAAGDGTSRVLWTNTNGASGVWSFNASDVNTAIGPTYGPYSGWTAGDLSVAMDGTSRVLWNNVSRTAGVWTFDANDAESIIGPTYGPY